ncbi:M4 family metallopeptidase [Pseudoalteromonas phenolica]|uniref:Peptidase M4 C-terminal domain-containing protein n=1 Tax=Pseudoalteromonas phenolica TaxID=161398 RepID=A0A0S2K6Z2_9GAMM|nr:M4 family metallopeptidase [Pseudoalteromonas phenolica]ALO43730.1 hypothetical protein PP2015_3253 [Pseudoalteromonas phenolica]MBE0355098.1 hypothetical protein [Pseudoalteromonas phenolica O-BC30]RXE93278.1 hypothetical protein D9981_20735 [Pseudoalteromonas phenolica O-BC30]
MKRHALMALLMPLISSASTFSFAAENTHFAVPAMMGNAKMGLLCAQAPEFTSQDCQTAVIPDTPLTRARFPYIPEQYNLFYRDENSQLFSQYSGYPFVVKHESGMCSLENPAVVTRQNAVNFPVYSYSCDGMALESANLSRLNFNYFGQGDFQTENDVHFYAGITMDILHQQLALMYPDSAEACTAGADYCLEQLSVIVDGDTTFRTSSWDGEHVLLDRGMATGGYFSHGSSLDIIAHETGHAVLTWNSDISFEFKGTAAIQEAFADLTAVLVRSEFYKRLQTGGEQNFIESDAHQQLSIDGTFYYAMAWDSYIGNKALRYLFSPMTDGASIDDWRDIETETPGPHYQAGILNRFFYRLSISDGWDIAKTFRLTMKAAQSCFVEDTSFEHAAFCLIDVADEQDKARVSAKLQEVGLIPTNSLANNLDFSIERLYTSINYALSESEQAELSAVNISLNEQPVHQWQANLNTPSQFNAIKQAQLNLESGEHLLSIETTNTQGQTKTGHRLLSIFSDPLCKPDTENVLSNQLSMNGEDFVLEQGYTFLVPQNAWYQQALGEFQFHNMPTDKVVSVFYDLNRDRQFSDDENVLSATEFDTAISLPSVDTVPSDMLVRLRIDDAAVSSCTANELSQSVDLKVHIEAGVPSTPIDFSYKQVEQTLHLTVLSSYGEQAMFRWILPEQVIEQTDSKLEQAVNTQGAYVVSLEHVENDRVLSRAEKQIELIADPNLAIACEAQGTQCEFTVSHTVLPEAVEYQWTLAGEQVIRQDAQPFSYDFEAYGVFNVALSMMTIDGRAEFSTESQITLEEVLPELDLLVGKQVNNTISLIADSELGEGFTLNWLIDGQLQSSHEKEITHNFTTAQTVTLQLLKSGEVVKEVSKLVTPMTIPNLTIQCVLTGTQCELSASHDLPDNNLIYQWQLNNETITKTSKDAFQYDFAGYGEFAVSLTLQVTDSNAEFTSSEVVHIQEPEPIPEVSFDVSQVNDTFFFSLNSPLPTLYEVTLVIAGQEYVLNEGKLDLELPNEISSYTFILRKHGQIIDQQTVSFIREANPNLDFVCVAEGLTCQLTATHNANTSVKAYVWSLVSQAESISTSDPYYEMQFTEAGTYDVMLTLVTVTGAQFTHQRAVTVEELPHEKIAILFSQHNSILKLEVSNEDNLGDQYQLVWLLNGEQVTSKQLEKELTTLATDYMVKLQVFMAGELVKEVSQSIYVYADIGLDFTWQNNTEKPLEFSFSSL